MNLINVKGIGKHIVFYINDQHDFTLVLDELNKRLEQPVFNGVNEIHACFNFGKRFMSEDELNTFFNCVTNKQKILIKEIIWNKQKNTDEMKTVFGIIRNGEIRHFSENIIFIGTINKGGILRSEGDVYLLGEVYGEINCLNKNSKIVGQYFSEATLRVGSSIVKELTSFATLLIYDKQTIVDITKRSEATCQESL